MTSSISKTNQTPLDAEYNRLVKQAAKNNNPAENKSFVRSLGLQEDVVTLSSRGNRCGKTSHEIKTIPACDPLRDAGTSIPVFNLRMNWAVVLSSCHPPILPNHKKIF